MNYNDFTYCSRSWEKFRLTKNKVIFSAVTAAAAVVVFVFRHQRFFRCVWHARYRRRTCHRWTKIYFIQFFCFRKLLTSFKLANRKVIWFGFFCLTHTFAVRLRWKKMTKINLAIYGSKGHAGTYFLHLSFRNGSQWIFIYVLSYMREKCLRPSEIATVVLLISHRFQIVKSLWQLLIFFRGNSKPLSE